MAGAADGINERASGIHENDGGYVPRSAEQINHGFPRRYPGLQQDAEGARATLARRTGKAARQEAVRQTQQVHVLPLRGRVPRPSRGARRSAHGGGQGDRGRAVADAEDSEGGGAIHRAGGFLPQVHRALQPSQRATDRTLRHAQEGSGAERTRTAGQAVSLGSTSAEGFRRAQARRGLGTVSGFAGYGARVCGAHRRIGIRHGSSSDAEIRRGTAADRVPLQEDARRGTSLPSARAGVAGNSQRAQGVAPLPQRAQIHCVDGSPITAVFGVIADGDAETDALGGVAE